MGTRRKRLSMFQDETENTETRRSSRIIALEEKKREERGRRKVVLALPADNNYAKCNNKSKEKGKEKMVVDDHLDDSSSEDEEHDPAKKGRKSKVLQQLISSTKEGQHPQSAGTSRTNVSSVNNIPEKSVLEFILDDLQRLDTKELFAEPVNPDVVKEYYRIVKQPMDFGTMRAKLHEDMYTNLEQFKRDVYLICFNAMNVNPANSRHYKVAEIIHSQARRVFEGVSADPEHIDETFSITKGLSNRNSQVRKRRSSRTPRAPPKLAGRDKATQSTVPETARRDMYWPPTNESLVSKFVNVNKFNIQLNQVASNYRDSLLQFVDGLGPIPQRVAAKKLEALNILGDVSGTQIITHPTPQEPTRPNISLNNADRLTLALAIPGTAAQEKRNCNTTVTGVNINDGTHQGNNTCVDNSWNAKAAAILSSNFINNDKGKSHSGCESSNARGTMDIWGPSKGKMVSPHENVLSFLGPVQEGTNTKGKTVQSATERSRRVLTRVWPTTVIQPKPLESQCGKSRSGLSLASLSRPRNSINIRDLSLVPKPTHLNNTFYPIQKKYEQVVLQPRSNNASYPLKNIYEPVVLQQPAHLNNTSPSIQKSHEQVLQQSASFIPSASSSGLQMKPPSQQNPLPLGRFRHEPKTALGLGMPSGSAGNYYGEGAALEGQTEDVTLQLLWDNDQQDNLSLLL